MTTPHVGENGWSSPIVERIARLVGDRAGLVFSRPRHASIEGTIRRQGSNAGYRDLAAYLDALHDDGAAVESLAAELTVGETYFFRDPGQFAVLRSQILPERAAAHGPDGRVRIWSAGCASGEEPYSIAIVCHELGLGERADIFGTDLSRERLRVAREARYGRWSLRGVSDEVTATYFRRRDTRYDLVATIRDMVEFQYLNLAELPEPTVGAAPLEPVDVVVCRNVLIYFDAATTARIVRHLLGALRNGGWLVLGASDPLISDYADCEVVVTTAGLMYRRASAESHTRPRSTGALETLGIADPPGLPTWAASDDTAVDARATVATALVRNTSVPSSGATSRDSVPAIFARMAEAHAHGRHADVVVLAREFLERGGNELSAWIMLTRALANAGSLSEAGHTCAAALEMHPLSAELTYLQALLLLHAGHFAESAIASRRALYLDRTLAVAHLTLGDSLARLGNAADMAECARAFRAAHRLLSTMDRDAVVPASGGERSGRLAASAAARLALVGGAT